MKWAGFLVLFLAVGVVSAGEPSPYVLMTGPDGSVNCTGVVMKTPRPDQAIYVATCGHCTNPPGSPAWSVFYADGVESEVIKGEVHRRIEVDGRDCAVVRYPSKALRKHPRGLSLSKEPVEVGDLVISVGTNAGGTRAPALQRVRVTRVFDDGYQFNLSDGAWPGHSGGPVIDANKGAIVGCVWGGGTGSAWATSAKMAWDLLLDRPRVTRAEPIEAPTKAQPVGQAFYSVPAEKPQSGGMDVVREAIAEVRKMRTGHKQPEQTSAGKGILYVYPGSRSAIEQVKADVGRHRCLQRFDWRYKPKANGWGTTRVAWKGRDGRFWKVDYRSGWPGAHRFLRDAGLGSTYGCWDPDRGGSSWLPIEPPIGGGDGRGGNWQNPWNSPNGSGQGSQSSGRMQALHQRIQELEDRLRSAETESLKAELKRQQEQAQRELQHQRELMQMEFEMQRRRMREWSRGDRVQSVDRMQPGWRRSNVSRSDSVVEREVEQAAREFEDAVSERAVDAVKGTVDEFSKRTQSDKKRIVVRGGGDADWTVFVALLVLAASVVGTGVYIARSKRLGVACVGNR